MTTIAGVRYWNAGLVLTLATALALTAQFASQQLETSASGVSGAQSGEGRAPDGPSGTSPVPASAVPPAVSPPQSPVPGPEPKAEADASAIKPAPAPSPKPPPVDEAPPDPPAGEETVAPAPPNTL